MKRSTIAMLALAAALPAVARAQDTTQTRDTTQARDTTQQTQQAPRTPADTNRAMQAQTQGAVGELRPSTTAGGNRTTGTTRGRRSSGAMNLTRDQVTQLQSALSGIGCDAGTADGVIGPKTRRAITCARQKNNVSSNEELYRSLNLDFSGSGGGASSSSSASDSALPSSNTQGVSADNPAASATRGDSSQVGGSNRGRIYPPADSIRRSPGTNPSGTRDSVMPNKAPGRDTTSRP